MLILRRHGLQPSAPISPEVQRFGDGNPFLAAFAFATDDETLNAFVFYFQFEGGEDIAETQRYPRGRDQRYSLRNWCSELESAA